MSWQTFKLQRRFNEGYDENVIKLIRNKFPNEQFKTACVIGNAGNFKSSLLNVFMEQDLLETSNSCNGVTEGVTVCLSNTMMLFDTEAFGTDNTANNRPDIVTLFCFCSAIIYVEKIPDRFPEKNITTSIENLTQIAKKIRNGNSNSAFPRLEIVLPLTDEDQLETKYLNDLNENLRICVEKIEKSDLRRYYSGVNATFLPPLVGQVRREFRSKTRPSYEIVPNNFKEKLHIIFNSVRESMASYSTIDMLILPQLLILAKNDQSFRNLSNCDLMNYIAEAKTNYKKYLSEAPMPPKNMNELNNYLSKPLQQILLNKNNKALGENLIALIVQILEEFKLKCVKKYHILLIVHKISQKYQKINLIEDIEIDQAIGTRANEIRDNFVYEVNRTLPIKDRAEIERELSCIHIQMEKIIVKNYNDIVKPANEEFLKLFEQAKQIFRQECDECYQRFEADPFKYNAMSRFDEINKKYDQTFANEGDVLYNKFSERIKAFPIDEYQKLSFRINMASIFRIRYFLCPYCQEPWEYHEKPKDAWFGCGNFTCTGRGSGHFGCRGVFRIGDKGDIKFPVAREIFFDVIGELYAARIQEDSKKKKRESCEII